MMESPILVAAKDPDRAKSYSIDVFEAFVSEAHRQTEFAVGDVVHAPRDTGLLYVCSYSKSDAGRTAQYYPEWPRIAGEVVRDGTVEWTATEPADANEATILSVVWAADTGLTVDSQSESAHVATVTVSGGVDGVDYELVATITPSAGNPRDVTLLVPVRSQ